MNANWFEAVLKRQEYENSTLRVVSVELEDAVPSGVNYASVIKRAKLTLVQGSGKTVTKTVIIKRAHTGSQMDFMLQFGVFRIETKIYRDVLNNMEALMLEFNDTRRKLWCDMLAYEPYTSIVFSDLKNEGFAMADRKTGLDKNHANLVLKSLGRFHAMSKILLDKYLINENDGNNYFLVSDSKVLDHMVKGGLLNAAMSMKKMASEEWQNIAERVEAQVDVALGKLKVLAEEVCDFKVLNHGDCWTCNLMFKYDESGSTPFSLRFLDFQVSHVNSFMWDVTYFLYSSVMNDVREKNLTEFYKVYWESLTSNLNFFGFQGTPPTFEELLKEADRTAYFAFYVFAILRPVMMSKGDKAFDLEKLNTNEDALNAFQPIAFDSVFVGTIEIFRSFVDRGLI